MSNNPFDQACRYLAKLDPMAFLLWLLAGLSPRLVFQRWLDTRTVPFPGEKDRICDTVAEWVDPAAPGTWWASVVEFQARATSDMFGRMLIYLGHFWLELRPSDDPSARFQVVAAVVNLTGVGTTSRVCTLPDTALETRLRVEERDLASMNAASVLTEIAAGRVARCILPFIPLMQGGADLGIIMQWKELAQQEPNSKRKADYGGLALVFAELAGCWAVWKPVLEGWGMEQSQQVLEWQAIAEKRGRAEGRAEAKGEALLEALQFRFPGTVPADLIQKIRTTKDINLLNQWFRASFTASLEEIQRLVGSAS